MDEIELFVECGMFKKRPHLKDISKGSSKVVAGFLFVHSVSDEV